VRDPRLHLGGRLDTSSLITRTFRSAHSEAHSRLGYSSNGKGEPRVLDFRSRLIRASAILAWLVKARSRDEVERIKGEARAIYGDEDGRLNLEALAKLGEVRQASPLDAGPLDA
jgi:hypothetical protein